jgi:hypothetical protein
MTVLANAMAVSGTMRAFLSGGRVFRQRRGRCMKSKFLWLTVGVVIALAVAGWVILRPRVLPPVRPTVPIKDGTTIDFSSGKPVVNNSAAEKAIIDAAVKAMNDAVKNIKFAPIAPPKVEAPAAAK